MNTRPRLLITMGDVAGIGPEIIARAWPALVEFARPIVVGDVHWLEQAVRLTGVRARVWPIRHPVEGEAAANVLPCLHATSQNLDRVTPGHVSAAAGRAAYDFLCCAVDHVLAGDAAAIVTAPLHKEGLRAGGVPFPGHTEILAERTATPRFGMALWCAGLAVVHVTLHMALREVFPFITVENVAEKIELLHGLLGRLIEGRPRLGVAALNPHASDGGLFGDEEARVLAPAIARGQALGIDVSGPWPSDALFVRAREGEFDGVVAMYHDQGHIALKLLGGRRAVNITAGLPLIRTSVAHGTAYDIAGQGRADAGSLIEAARVAARLCATARAPL